MTRSATIWRRTASVAMNLAERSGHPVGRPEFFAAFDPLKRRDLYDTVAMNAVIAGVLRRDSSAIDVGANYGSVLREIVRHSPEGRHIAFEPIPALAESLAREFPTVDIRQSALSDSAGTAQFSHVTGAPGYSGLRLRRDLPAGSGTVQNLTVRIDRLDDVLPQDFNPSLIKIDVEGAELGVLSGAAKTLARSRPVVIFEHGAGGADIYGTASTEVWDLFDDCGFRILSVTGEGPYSRAAFADLFTAPQWNYMAVPDR